MALTITVLLSTAFWSEPWAAQMLFTPELTLSESYSDNIFLNYKDEEADYITSAGANLTLETLGRTAGLRLTYNPSYNAYANHSELDYWRQAGRLLAWNDFSPNTRLQLTDDYLESEDPLDESEPFQVEETIQGPTITTDINRRGRNKIRTNVAESRLTHQFGSRDNIYIAVQHLFLEEVDPAPGTQVGNYSTWQPMLGAEYWFVQRWGFSIDGYYSNRDYTDQNDRQEYTGRGRFLHAFNPQLNGFIQYRHTYLNYDQEIDNDYTISEPSAGITYEFGQNANISIGGGYYVQDFENRERNQEGMILNSDIYKRWVLRSGYMDLTGISGQRIDDAGTEDLGLNMYYVARIEIGHDFTTRLSGNIYGSYRYDEYPNRDPEQKSNTITSGAGVTFQILQWMLINLNYDYRNHQSDIEDDEYVENRATIMFTLRPSRPYRLN